MYIRKERGMILCVGEGRSVGDMQEGNDTDLDITPLLLSVFRADLPRA
jgi:hypothetical protein